MSHEFEDELQQMCSYIAKIANLFEEVSEKVGENQDDCSSINGEINDALVKLMSHAESITDFFKVTNKNEDKLGLGRTIRNVH